MSFDLASMTEHVGNGPVARVVVAATQGSVPREVGASMLVGASGLIEGTIGGGALEHEAIEMAKVALFQGEDRMDRRPLGPALGQCCGGAVTLLTEIWDAPRLATIDQAMVARPLPGEESAPSLAVSRLFATLRDGRAIPALTMVDGWIVEGVSRPHRVIWVWGAGHVGRATVSVLEPLPGIELCWSDSDESRFPKERSGRIRQLIAENPADLVPLASAHAEHYVLTYSHALDLEICHRILMQPFAFLGLIGSATKRARFRSRLAALGHSDNQIDRMTCPIGDPSLGKHPQEIALGVASEILRRRDKGAVMSGKHA